MTEPDAPFVVAKLVGYIGSDVDHSTFVMPVFVDLDTGKPIVQVSDENDLIIGFNAISFSYRKIAPGKGIIKKVGDQTLFGILLDDMMPFFATKNVLVTRLRQLLESGVFNDIPAFALTVAKFVEEGAQVERFKRELFQDMPLEVANTRKHFLENDVIRDSLYRAFPKENHQAIALIKIDVSGTNIKLKLPRGVSEDEKARLGNHVTSVFKSFVGAEKAELSFGEDDAKDIIRREAASIRSGRMTYSGDIFDLPEHAHMIHHRDSAVIIPDASYDYFKIYRNKSTVAWKFLSPFNPNPLISPGTARKIVGAETVSLVSAMLFRLMALGDIQAARHSPKFQLHVCFYSVRRDQIERFNELTSGVTTTSRKYSLDDTFPISFLVFLVDRGIIPASDAKAMFRINRSGYFRSWSIRHQLLTGWLDFSLENSNLQENELAKSIFEQASRK